MSVKTIYIKEVDSTNRFLQTYSAPPEEEMTVVWADSQTAGRGCGTNTWESETGQNLTFSVLLHPRRVAARDQFILSMANAVALKRTLDAYTEGIVIKWPNDIYWHDRKLCGTLIEPTIGSGLVKSCIVGTGINVNQRLFHSDAPNPVSLWQILGRATDREEMLRNVVRETVCAMARVDRGEWSSLRADYRAALYRKSETHCYQWPDGKRARLTLIDVEDDGHLLLSDAGGRLLRFGFKEIQFVTDD